VFIPTLERSCTMMICLLLTWVLLIAQNRCNRCSDINKVYKNNHHVCLSVVIELLLHMMMMCTVHWLVALHDDDVYYMLFHMRMMCTVHILIVYSACIGLAEISGCLPVTYNWISLWNLQVHWLHVAAIVHAAVIGSHIMSFRCYYTRGLLII